MAKRLIVARCEWGLVDGRASAPVRKTDAILIRSESDVESLIAAVRAKATSVARSIDPSDVWHAFTANSPRTERERVTFGRGDDRRWWRVTWEVWPAQ